MSERSFSIRLSRSPDRGAGAAPLAPALAAGLLWLLAALITGYWLLHLWGRSPLTPVAALGANPLQADAASLARTLGALPTVAAGAPAAVPVSSRFQLLGLVDQPGPRGAALIAVDGQPPRPVAVGGVVEGALRLLSVGRRAVRVGEKQGDPAAFELSLPELTE